jgi:lipoprotein-anchoring transpeptidase ErfK/SrfK
MRPTRLILASLLAAAAHAGPVAAYETSRERVAFDPSFEAGTIVVRTRERRLYFVLGNGTAMRYRIAVGKPGRQWFGRVAIDGKYRSPAWTAPADLRRSSSGVVIPGGSPRNPMGAAALTLVGDRYAIHGTNQPASIGTYASAGCIRMLNDDVLDLFDKVNVGTPVLVQR